MLERWKFRRRARRWRELIARELGDERAMEVLAAAEREYEDFLPEIRALPGGVLNGALGATYEYLAYGKALKAVGCTVAEIGEVYRGFHTISFQRVPRWLLPLVRRLGVPWLRRRLRQEATHAPGAMHQEGHETTADAQTESQLDGGWRYAYVESEDGQAFGIDVTQCAVCALFSRHAAAALVPSLCRLDDLTSKALDLGLRRDGVRAEGAPCCDFRFRPGEEPKPLPPGVNEVA